MPISTTPLPMLELWPTENIGRCIFCWPRNKNTLFFLFGKSTFPPKNVLQRSSQVSASDWSIFLLSSASRCTSRRRGPSRRESPFADRVLARSSWLQSLKGMKSQIISWKVLKSQCQKVDTFALTSIFRYWSCLYKLYKSSLDRLNRSGQINCHVSVG